MSTCLTPLPARVSANASSQRSSGTAEDTRGSSATARESTSASARRQETLVEALPDVTVSSLKQTRTTGSETEARREREPGGVARDTAHVHPAARGGRNLRGEQANRPRAHDEHLVPVADDAVRKRLATAGERFHQSGGHAVEPVRDAVEVL